MTPEQRQAARARCDKATEAVDDLYSTAAASDRCTDNDIDELRELKETVDKSLTDLPAALDELDAKDKRIAELEYQVNSFREGLQLARDLYREKSGKPDRFSDEGDWWQNPDDQCVVLWLIEWAEDIQSDLIKQLGADKTRMEGALKRLRDFDTDKTVSGAWLYGFCDAALRGEGQ